MPSTSVGRSRRARLAFIALTSTALGVTLCAPAQAQTVAPPPVRQSVDANGVDLFLGTLNVVSPKVSMGDGDTGLSYYFFNTGSGWTDNVTAALNQNGNVVTVRLGASTDDFTASGTTYTSRQGRGATLTFSGGVYTYTATDGTVAHFASSKANAAPYFASLGRATDIVSPSGEKLVYAYESVTFCSNRRLGDACTSHATAYRLTSITNSYGYRLALGYASNDTPDPDEPYAAGSLGDWSRATGTGLSNAARESALTRSLSTSSTTSSFVVTDAANRKTSYRQSGGQVLGITRAGSTTENITITYSGNRVTTVSSVAGIWTYGAPSDVTGARTVTVTDPSNQTTTYVFDIASQRMKQKTDALSHTTKWDYDTSGRLTKATAHETNSVEHGYDAGGNVTSTTIHAKNASQPDIVTTAHYPASCTPATCHQPDWTEDALHSRTNYIYDPTHGGVTSVKLPAPTNATNAVRPEVRTSYTAYTDFHGGTVYRATGTSTCRTTASCTDAADETVTSTVYGTLAENNLRPKSMTIRAGDNSVSATTAATYDAVGNVVSATDATGAVSQFVYDADRWPTLAVGPDPDGSGPLKNRATRTNYNDDGTVASTEVGTADADGSNFASLQQTTTGYDPAGRKVKDTVTAGGTTFGLTQYSYDPANRATCAAVRMNPAAFGNLPASACSLGTQGPDGPDRITRTTYDEVGRSASVTNGYGTPDAAVDVRANYTANGQVQTATDAKENVTTYGYDA